MIDENLRELYQEVILDHGKNPRHFHKMDHPSHEADGHNPLCGDQIHLYVSIVDGTIADVSFEGKGCAICMASASMMTDIIRNKPLDEAQTLARAFCEMAKGETSSEIVAPEDMERLEVLSGVSQFPMRVKCATLAWHTFESACEQESREVVEAK